MKSQTISEWAKYRLLLAILAVHPLQASMKDEPIIDLRDPFTTTLEREQAFRPELLTKLDPWQAIQQIRQWRLQGIFGNSLHGLWGLIHRPPSQWRCIRTGEQWLGYKIIGFDQQRVILQRSPSSPTEESGKMITLPWAMASVTPNLVQP